MNPCKPDCSYPNCECAPAYLRLLYSGQEIKTKEEYLIEIAKKVKKKQNEIL